MIANMELMEVVFNQYNSIVKISLNCPISNSSSKIAKELLHITMPYQTTSSIITRCDFKDKIVMDAGSGLGIFAIFAANAGASKV